MSKTRIIFFVFVLLGVFISVEAKNNYKWTTTGFRLDFKGESLVVAPTFKALKLEYFTQRDAKDVDGLRQDAEYIIIDFISDVIRAGHDGALITSHKVKAGNSVISSSETYTFVFSKKGDKWVATDEKLNEFLQVIQTPGIKPQIKGFKVLSDKGDTCASILLAKLYSADKQYKKSEELYQNLANNGNPCAMTELFVLYQQLGRTNEKALDLLTKAAEMGFSNAQYNLGTVYLNQAMKAKDPSVPAAKAKAYFEAAYRQGVLKAGVNLGAMYTMGIGVKKDPKKAFVYTKEAAEKGLVSAQSNMGYLYALAIGTPQDCEKAIKFIKMALDADFPQAYDNMGSMYEMGCGVKKDLKEALSWFKISADKGCPEGKADYERLKKEMAKM